MTRQRRNCWRRLRRGGFSLVEVVASTLIVGVVLVGALEAVGMVFRTRRMNADRLTGPALAQELMAEILATAYEDPEYPGGSLGVELGESSTNRAAFDDVDDYLNYSTTSARARNGVAISGFTGWRQQVAVSWVRVADPSATAFSDAGLKRITVTITSPQGETTVLDGWRARKGALEQKPALDTTVVAWLGAELKVGNAARSERWGANLANHAADVN